MSELGLSDTQGVASRLRDARRASGLTQKEVAAKLGVERKTYWKWENGHADPQVDAIPAIADALGVTTRYVLFGLDPLEVEIARLRGEITEVAREVTLLAEEVQAGFAAVRRWMEAERKTRSPAGRRESE